LVYILILLNIYFECDTLSPFLIFSLSNLKSLSNLLNYRFSKIKELYPGKKDSLISKWDSTKEVLINLNVEITKSDEYGRKLPR